MPLLTKAERHELRAETPTQAYARNRLNVDTRMELLCDRLRRYYAEAPEAKGWDDVLPLSMVSSALHNACRAMGMSMEEI